MVLYRWIGCPCNERPGAENSEWNKILQGQTINGRHNQFGDVICFFPQKTLCISEKQLHYIITKEPLKENESPHIFRIKFDKDSEIAKSATSLDFSDIDCVLDGIANKGILIKVDIPDDIFNQMVLDKKASLISARYSGEPLGINNPMYILNEVHMPSYDKDIFQYITLANISPVPELSYADLIQLSDSANIIMYDENAKVLFLTSNMGEKVYIPPNPEKQFLSIASYSFSNNSIIVFDGNFDGTNRTKIKNPIILMLKEQNPTEKGFGSSYLPQIESEYVLEMRSFLYGKQCNLDSRSCYILDGLLRDINEIDNIRKGIKTIQQVYQILGKEIPQKVQDFYQLKEAQAIHRISYPLLEENKMVFVGKDIFIKVPNCDSIWKSNQGDFLTSQNLADILQKNFKKADISVLAQIMQEDSKDTLNFKRIQHIDELEDLLRNRQEIDLTNVSNIIDSLPNKLKSLPENFLKQTFPIEDLSGSKATISYKYSFDIQSDTFYPVIVWESKENPSVNVAIEVRDSNIIVTRKAYFNEFQSLDKDIGLKPLIKNMNEYLQKKGFNASLEDMLKDIKQAIKIDETTMKETENKPEVMSDASIFQSQI